MTKKFKPTQNVRQKGYDLTRLTRDIANTDGFVVRRNLRKSPEWKEYLLPLVTDDFIFNHLKYMQPFCVYSVSDNLVEYEIPYYYYPLYIKVRLDTREVISFHYSVDNRDNRLKTNIELKTYIQDGEEVCDVLLEQYSRAGEFRIPFGGGTYIEPRVVADESDDKTYILPAETIRNMIEVYKQEYLEKLLKRVDSYFTPFERKQITELLSDTKEDYITHTDKNLNTLTYSNYKAKDSALSLISMCYDIYLQDRENQLWLRESINTYLSTLDKGTLEDFILHLPNLLPANQIIFPKTQEIEETSEFSDK